MKLGTEIDLGPGHIMLDGNQLPPPQKKGGGHRTHVCCGQTAGWIKTPLGMEVGLGPEDIVLDGDQLCPQKQGAQQLPLFGPCIVAKRLNGSRCHGREIDLGPRDIVLDGDLAFPKGAQPPIFDPCLL